MWIESLAWTQIVSSESGMSARSYTAHVLQFKLRLGFCGLPESRPVLCRGMILDNRSGHPSSHIILKSKTSLIFSESLTLQIPFFKGTKKKKSSKKHPGERGGKERWGVSYSRTKRKRPEEKR